MENQQTELESKSSESQNNEITDFIVSARVERNTCVWYTKEVCKIPVEIPCMNDCSLKTLEFTSDAIIQRMKDENQAIQKLKREGFFKNRKKIVDLLGGTIALHNALKTHFNIINPLIVDKDIEKPIIPPKGGWRKGLLQ